MLRNKGKYFNSCVKVGRYFVCEFYHERFRIRIILFEILILPSTLRTLGWSSRPRGTHLRCLWISNSGHVTHKKDEQKQDPMNVV